MDIHCARLSSQPVLSPAACTQTGCRDRSTCTVCRSAAQIRTLDTSLPAASPAARCHTGHNVKPHAFPAGLPAVGRAHDPISADHWSAPLVASSFPRSVPFCPRTPSRGPDIHVADISPHTLQLRQVLSTQPRPPRNSFAGPLCSSVPSVVAHFSRRDPLAFRNRDHSIQ